MYKCTGAGKSIEDDLVLCFHTSWRVKQFFFFLSNNSKNILGNASSSKLKFPSWKFQLGKKPWVNNGFILVQKITFPLTVTSELGHS